MAEFHPVCQVRDLGEGESTTVRVCNKLIALFCQQGQFYAIDDVCPHMGASLSGGHVAKGVVTCPWHAWSFSIEDGTWMDNKRGPKIGSYPVQVAGDEIQIQVKAAPPQPRPEEPQP